MELPINEASDLLSPFWFYMCMYVYVHILKNKRMPSFPFIHIHTRILVFHDIMLHKLTNKINIRYYSVHCIFFGVGGGFMVISTLRSKRFSTILQLNKSKCICSNIIVTRVNIYINISLHIRLICWFYWLSTVEVQGTRIIPLYTFDRYYIFTIKVVGYTWIVNAQKMINIYKNDKYILNIRM